MLVLFLGAIFVISVNLLVTVMTVNSVTLEVEIKAFISLMGSKQKMM